MCRPVQTYLSLVQIYVSSDDRLSLSHRWIFSLYPPDVNRRRIGAIPSSA
jgi:hypothetical protein